MSSFGYESTTVRTTPQGAILFSTMLSNSRSGRTALVGLLLVPCCILAYILLSGEPAGEEGLGGPGSTLAAEVLPGTADALSADIASPESRIELGPANLVIRALDPEGNAIEAFQVFGQLQVAGKEEAPEFLVLASDRPGVCQDLEPGDWRFRIESSLRFPVTISVSLEPGGGVEREVVLRPGALVEGELKNEYGTLVGATWLWFMPPGRTHPYLERKTGGLTRARIEPDGTFRSPLLEPGSYIISVGPLGRSDLADDQTQSLLPLSHYHVSAVMGGREQLEILVEGLPDDGFVRAEVTLLEPGESRADKVRRKLDHQGKTAAQIELAVEQDAAERALDPKKKDKKPRWKRKSDRSVDREGKVFYALVRPGRYRLSLEYKRSMQQSEIDLVMEPGVSKFVVLAYDAAVEGSRREPAPLSMSVSNVLPDMRLGGVGFHWSRLN